MSCTLQDFNRTKPAKNLPRELCYGPQDFRIGTYVQVYGRDFLVHDCDDFTRHWYQVGIQAVDLQPCAASCALSVVLHILLASTQQVCINCATVLLRQDTRPVQSRSTLWAAGDTWVVSCISMRCCRPQALGCSQKLPNALSQLHVHSPVL